MPIVPIEPKESVEERRINPPRRSRSRSAQNIDKASEKASREPPAPEADAGYTVGYKKPPIGSRFKPGVSGNPKGRPKSAKGLHTIVRDTLTQKVAVRTSTGEKRISRIEAAVQKTLELAMKGNPRALAQLLKLYEQAVPEPNVAQDLVRPKEDLTATDIATLEELRQILLAEQEDER
ncbi:MAG: hypothetical protein CL955_09185 [Erythrobacteraceae bacterium]|nr:hypothetical protein [Erythrobacteraceae bacterium]|tara:strand:- start:130 stop:663 length:534 start_codon:yes stop_codon:yes gene_type:complete